MTTRRASTFCRSRRSGQLGGADDRCRRWGWWRSPTASTEAVAVADGRSPRRSARALFLACVQEDICRAWQERAAEAAPTRAPAKARGFPRPHKARKVDAFAVYLELDFLGPPEPTRGAGDRKSAQWGEREWKW